MTVEMSLDNLEYSVMLTSLAKKAGEVNIPVTRLASLLVATGLVTVGQLVLAQVQVYTKPVLSKFHKKDPATNKHFQISRL